MSNKSVVAPPVEAQKPRPMAFSSEVAAAVANLPLPPDTERAAHATGSTLLPEVDNKEDHIVMETKTEQTSV